MTKIGDIKYFDEITEDDLENYEWEEVGHKARPRFKAVRVRQEEWVLEADFSHSLQKKPARQMQQSS